VVDAKHIRAGDSGLHVFLVQEALILLDGGRIKAAELNQWRYGPSTAAAVLRYKQARDIVNRSYQQTADDIVGKMTIASLDQDMYVLETGIVRLGGAALRLGSILLGGPTVLLSVPKRVVITETALPWSKWAEQFVAADPARHAKVPIPNGTTLADIADAYKSAIGTAGPGGSVIISVGHGGAVDVSTEDGRLDLGPAGSFKVGGRNALLVGDPPPSHPSGPVVFHDTRAFYADSPGPGMWSRKEEDEHSGSPVARRRLANWKAYADIAAAFKAQRLAQIVLLTCRVGAAAGLILRVAQQWGNPVLGYKRRVIGQEIDGRARVFLEGDPPGTFYQWPNTTNTPASETFWPIARDSVQVSP
jgi:hypothetical protein